MSGTAETAADELSPAEKARRAEKIAAGRRKAHRITRITAERHQLVEERDVIIRELRHEFGMTFEEIAQIMGLTRPAVHGICGSPEHQKRLKDDRAARARGENKTERRRAKE